MTLGDIRVVKDVPAAFAETVITAYRARPEHRFTLVLSGGETARQCYERLAADSLATGTIAWSEVDVLMGDERCVPPGDPDANQRLVREALLDRVGEVGSFRPMRCEGSAGECGAAARGYEAELRSILEAGRRIDFVHLGLGPDGHTASLFPDSEALNADDSTLVTANVDPHGVNPHIRMTLTYGGIALASQVVFTVAGRSKRAAVEGLRRGDPLPAARVRAGRVTWLVDPDAAGEAGEEAAGAAASTA